MNVLLEQILRIENGVVACDAKDDLVELAPGCFRAASMLDKCKGGNLQENRPRRECQSESAS